MDNLKDLYKESHTSGCHSPDDGYYQGVTKTLETVLEYLETRLHPTWDELPESVKLHYDREDRNILIAKDCVLEKIIQDIKTALF